MLALYRSSRQAEALQVYRVAQRELAEQLALVPCEELKELERAILRHDPELDAAAPEPRLTTARPPPERSLIVVPAVGAGSVWVTTEEGRLIRVEPGPRPIQQTIEVGNDTEFVAFAAGAVRWRSSARSTSTRT
jgi:hypothetical protein